MNEIAVPIKLLISLLLGAAIGLEREIHARSESPDTKARIQGVLGIRSFSLITLLGGLCGILYHSFQPLSLLLSASFVILLISYYVVVSILTKDIGITTEIGVIISFLIGFAVTAQLMPIAYIIALTVVLIMILSRKEKIKKTVSLIHKNEINAFISYAIIALVILPFLPNKPIYFADIPFFTSIVSAFNLKVDAINNIEIINFYRLWFIVALITGVDVAGYIMERLVGQKKGLLLTSVVGGFISSTATTQSLAIESKSSKSINRLVASAIFANLSSFLQIMILIASINTLFLVKSTPVLLTIIFSALIIGIYFLTRDKMIQSPDTAKRRTQTNIFSLPQALKFASLFLVIRLFSKLSLVFFGNSGLLVISALGSLAGVDAVTINISELSGNIISYQTGLSALVISNAVNLSVKGIYSFIGGNRKFAVQLGTSLVIIILASIVAVLII